MPTDTHQINVLSVNVDLYFSGGLSSISVEKYLFLFTESSYLLNVLSDTNLIMDKNDTNTEYLFLWLLDSFFEQFNIQNPSLINWQIGDFKALKF